VSLVHHMLVILKIGLINSGSCSLDYVIGPFYRSLTYRRT